MLGNGDVHAICAPSGKEALEQFQRHEFDGVVLDLNLPDISGYDLPEKMNISTSIQLPPVIVYTGKDLTKKE